MLFRALKTVNQISLPEAQILCNSQVNYDIPNKFYKSLASSYFIHSYY